MGKYGSTAVRTAGLLRGGCESADEAWQSVAGEVFDDAPDARDKACPREAFLGLCAAGLVRGVSPGTCPEPSRSPNRRYSITAVRLLAADPDLARGSKIGLWRRVLRELGMDPKKKPNEQMEVVLALWEQGLLDASTTQSTNC
jgi:hypothetical protein